MNKNEKLSRIIEYKGTLDISQIVANFKKMQQELRGRGTKETDILNLEGEIQKIQTLDKTIQKMIGKGFKTPKEFAEFDKLTSQMNRSIEQLNEQFRRTDAKSLADSLKQAQNHTKRLRTNTDELERAYSSYLKDVLKNNEAKADITKAITSNIQNAKEQKTLEYDISKIIQDEIKKQEQKIKNDEIALQKQKNLLQTYQNQREALKDITNFSFSEQINGENRNFKSNFLNTNNYKQSDGSAITDEQMQKITNTLNTMFSKKTLPDMDKFVNSLKNSGIELVNVEGKTKLLTDAYRAYQQQLNNISSREKESNSALKEKQAAIEQAKTSLGALNKAYGSGQGDIIGHLQNVLSSINKVIDAETKEKQLQTLYNAPLTGLSQNIALQNRLTTTLEENSNATKAVIKDQQNLDSTFDQIGNRLKYLLSFMNAWNITLRTIRQTFNDIQKIDKAFAEIAMVTDYSISDMWAQYNDYAEIANELGQTTESVIKSSALYYQQGLQANEVLSLTKDTMKLATLSGIDFSESTKLMTAALRSFHMEMEQGAHVTDVYSELAAHAAADVSGIAYAMSKTSSIAASAGMDFEKLSAMLTVMIEATQEAPENLGTAMKSVVARFTEVKKDMSDIEGDIEDMDINKVDAALKSVGIDLKDQVGQIRDLDDVFLELSAIWNDLDRNSQRYIATITAGSRQQSRFISLMENYERTTELIEVAQDSAGRSSEQFAKYADSLENKVNKLKNTWEQFRISLTGSDLAKSGVDFANTFIQTFSKLDAKQLGTIVLFGVTIGRNLMSGLLQGFQNATNTIGTAFGNLFTKATTGLSLGDLQLNLTTLEKNKNDAKLALQEIEQKYQETKNKLDNSPLTLTRSSNYYNEVQNITTSFQRFKDILEITDEKILETANVEELLKNSIKQSNYTVDENSTEYTKLVQELEKYKRQLEEVKKKQDNVTSSNQQYKNSLIQLQKGKFAQGLGNALSVGLTTAITGAITGQDWSQIFTSSAITTGISALTQLLQGNIGGAIGSAAVAGVSIGLALINKKLKEEHEEWKLNNNEAYRLEKTVERLNALQDEYNKKLDEANEKYNKEKSNWEEIEKADKSYQKLKDQIVLSDEEQQELNSSVQTLIDLCPELEVSYDAQGNALLEIIKDYDEIIARQKESMRLAEAEANKAEIEASTIQVLSLKTQLKQKEELKKQYDELSKLIITGPEIDRFSNNPWFNQLTEGAIRLGQYDPLYGGIIRSQPEYEYWLPKFLSQEKYINFGDSNTGNLLYAFTEKSDAFRELVLNTANDYYESTFTTVGEVIDKITDGNNQEGWKYFREKLIENYEDLYGLEELGEETKKLQEEYNKAIDTATGDMLSRYIETETALQTNLDDIEPEHQNMVLETIINNLDTGEFKKQYEQYINDYTGYIEEGNEESAKEVSNKITTLTEDFFKDNKKEVNSIIEAYTGVTETQWEKIQEFQTGLAARTAEQNKKLLEQLAAMGVIHEAIQQLEQQMSDSEDKSIELGLKVEEYDVSLGGKIAAQQIPLEVSEKIGDQIDNRETPEEKRRYANYINQKIESHPELLDNPAALNTIITFDYEGTNAVNQTSRFNSLKEALMDTGLEEEIAEAIVKDIDINKSVIFNVSTEIEDVTDADSFLTSYEQVIENVRTNAGDIISTLYSRGKNYQGSMSVSLEEYEKMVKEFEKVANPGKELADGAVAFDYNKYFEYDESQGRMVIKDVEAMQEAWEKAVGSISPIMDRYIELKKLGKERNENEEALFQLLSRQYPALKIYEQFWDMQAKAAQKANNEYKEIGDTIDSLVSDYSTMRSELNDDGFISASTKAKIINDINDLNEKLVASGNSDKQIDWTKVLNPNSFKLTLINLVNQLKSSANAESQMLASIYQGYIDKINEIDLENAKKEWKKYAKAAEEAAEKVKEAQEAQEEFVKSTGSFVSNYKNAASEMLKEGKITSSTYSTLASDLEKINERYNLGLSINDYVDANGSFNWTKYEKDLEKFIIELQKEGVEADYLTQVLNDLKDAHKELDEELEEVTKEYEESLKEVESASKSVESANKSLSEAYDDLAEKEKKVKELQEELNELMYGTGDKRKSTLDGMYNYEQLLDVIDSDLESIKTNLDHIGPNDNISELVNSYGQNMRNKKINLEAQKRVYENNLSEILGNIGQYSSYYTMQNGRLLADVAALNRASMNDDIKNEIENQIQMYNDSAKKISDIEKQIKQVEQDFLDFRKTYRDKYINLQEKVISTMKEEAQKELQTQQEKYAALEEADNEYTSALEEAIQKQRDLRNQSTEWEDLAQKEKKLSLLQRDTSGANQKEVLKQQEEIEKSRENLLDKGIDNIIKGLKDLYSDQKKTRDAEIKYQQAVLDNATYIEEANAVINSWQTADDLISWFYEHSQEVQSMTNEQLEAYNEELEELYNDREIYMNTSMEDFIKMLDVQENEIDDTVTNVAEHLTMESTRSLNEVMAKVDEAILKAQEDIDSAIQDVQDAKDKITEAIKAVADAVSKLEEANKKAADAAEKLAKVQEQANKASIEVSNSSSSSEEIKLTPNPIQQHISNIQQQMGQGVHGTSGWSVSDDELAKIAEGVGQYMAYSNGAYYWGSTLDELSKYIGFKVAHNYATPDGTFVYAKGGLVDYTGPAWVDGTPAQPEAFLSAKDTQMIAQFTDVLRTLYDFKSPNSNQVNPSIGDTHIEVHINIENVASDYDVDQAVERVKQDIIDAANQTGRNVILYQ